VLGWSQSSATRITFLSVGQGDCAVIQSDGRTVLVDAGPKSAHFDAGERIVLPKLRQLGVDQVDLILLSHPDMDHIGGTAAILRAYPDARVVVSAQFRNDAEMTSHVATLGIPASKISWIGSESAGQIGDLRLRLACPPFSAGQEENNGSMFVRVGRGGAWAVFSGDAPSAVENQMSLRGDWSAEVLKAGHHGSRTASGATWLHTVHPQCVVVSCGRDNSYGHPHKETLDRIAAAGASLARTDRDGDIAFELQGNRFVRVTP